MEPQRPKTISFLRIIKLLLLVCLGLYVLVCAAMAFWQRSLLYFPTVATTAEVDRMAASANLQRWTNSSGQFIGFKRPSPRQPATGNVMIACGNGSTATGCSHYADDFQNVAGLNVFILEYPGYEDRPGKPTEKNLFAAAANAFQMLPTNTPVYLVGESLGSGVASYLAGTFTNRIDGIILISPFNSVATVAQCHYPFLPVWLLLVDRFPSDQYLRRFHGCVGITVGNRDTVVPAQFGRRLYDGCNSPKKLWEFPNAGHCQISGAQSKFWKDAFDFLQTRS